MVEALYQRRIEWTPLERVWFAYCAAAAALGRTPQQSKSKGVPRVAWFSAWVALRFGDVRQFAQAVEIAQAVGFVSGREMAKARPGGCLLMLDGEPVQRVRNYIGTRREAR